MRHPAQELSKLHRRLHQAATLVRFLDRQKNGTQGKHTCLMQQYCCSGPSHAYTQQHHTCSVAGKCAEQAGPDISQLAPHLQEEWDHAANAHLGSSFIAPQSNRKVWWTSGICKTGQSHRWQATVNNRTHGSGCPYEIGRAVCHCNDLAHNHREVAAEWDREANGKRMPENVAAGSRSKAAWRCGLCGHSWIAKVTQRILHRNGCPQCAREASRQKTRHPSISSGPAHLLAEWDWEANETHGWHPDLVTLGSGQQVHWIARDECKLGLVHRWQAAPYSRTRTKRKAGSPFPSSTAVCACNSLGVQCPEAADLWDLSSNGGLTPNDVAMQSSLLAAWKAPDGRQWHQFIYEVVRNVRRQEARMK